MISLNFTKNIIAAKKENILARARAYKDYREVAGRDFSVFYHKSDLPLPLICVHVDTVRKEKLKIISDGKIIVNAYGVLGADDRAGCAIALYLMREGVKAHFGFFDFEEVGGIGSREYCATHEADIKTYVKTLIGLDRRGGDDATTYGGECQPLMDVVAKYGYKSTFGSFTDVANIESVHGVGCVNLSVGFHREHQKNEYLDLEEMRYTASVMPEIIEDVMQIDTSPASVSVGAGFDWFGWEDYYYDESVRTLGGKRRSGVVGKSSGRKINTRSFYGNIVEDDYDDFDALDEPLLDPYRDPYTHVQDEPYASGFGLTESMPKKLSEIPPANPKEDAVVVGGSSLWERTLDRVRKNAKSKAMK